MITIVDYGMGNLGSILNMLRRIGIAAGISSSPQDVKMASKLILPGVGAFDAGIANLNASGLREALDEAVIGRKVPVLGVCLGMQLMGRGSEEGELPGLGWIPAHATRFSSNGDTRLRIPHMGWNTVSVRSDAAKNSLFTSLEIPLRFYFVHSYHLVCDQPADVVATVHYGTDVTAALERNNLMGVQFHPEKSHRHGMSLYRAFAAIPEVA